MSYPRTYPRTYAGKHLLQIAMPMGGIGAGSLSLSGIGGIQDFAIRNRPSFTAMPDGHGFTDAAFALLRVGDVTKLLEGLLPPEKIYDQGLQGQGYRKGGHEGLPRFENCTFTNRYPFGEVELSDKSVPITVKITGWSPFIPLDDKDSGIPAAIVEYRLTNTSQQEQEFAFSYHTSHWAMGKGGERGTRNSTIENGVLFTNTDEENAETFGSAALKIIKPELRWSENVAKTKAMWFRSGWFDSLAALWAEVSEGRFIENDGSGSQKGLEGRNGGSVQVEGKLNPEASVVIPVILTWHFPNSGVNVGVADETDKSWQPYYTNFWKDAGEVATYVAENHDSLRARTEAFAHALHSSTLLPEVIREAISSNLAILKSPTVLRQKNGNVWGWEGCFVGSGCCHGTCTHVWNYAQAMPHLFPALERTFVSKSTNAP
jgi:uncharacterized protein (DUF608 family)